MTDLPGRGFRRAVVHAGEFDLDYADSGPTDAALTIVSLPGSAGLEMSTAKDRLAATHRVIEINPPGWGGKTDVDRPIEQRELGRLLGEAATTVVDGPFLVIGTSMGGANALYLAEQFPDRVLGLVLEGSMAPAAPGDLRQPSIDPAEVPERPAAYPAPPAHPNKPWATPEVFHRQMADRMAMFRWTKPDMSAASAIAAVRARDIPVLVLLGDEDEILAPSLEKTVREALPHADFRVVPAGTRDLQNTAPDAFVDAVGEFVTTLQTVRRAHA